MGISVVVPLLLLLGLFSFAHGDLLPVPAKDITTEQLREYLSIGNINIDIPALYVFGEAYVEAGNTPFLALQPGNDKVGRFNFLPYGCDLLINGKPTGRSSNGRIVADFVAQVLGLPFPPPVLGMSDAEKKDTLTGASYSSAGASILTQTPDSRKALGDIISFEEQIDLFENTTQDALKAKFNTPERAAEYYSKSLFFISMGGNDMEIQWNSLYINISTYKADFSKYAALVSQEYVKKIERLFKLGARKFVINNVPPMYCMINIATKSPKPCMECLMNKNIDIYNHMIQASIKTMETNLKGSKFFLVDVFNIFGDAIRNPQSYGFTHARETCCETFDGRTPCLEGKPPCSDKNAHIYFDLWHPTESMHFLWARRMLTDNSVVSPTTLVEFVQQE